MCGLEGRVTRKYNLSEMLREIHKHCIFNRLRVAVKLFRARQANLPYCTG
jgi:hypothetical protein